MPRLKSLLLSFALLTSAGAATPALARPVSVSVGVGFGAGVTLDGLAARVSPYGNWVTDASYGHVFVPSYDYTPYANGYWQQTSYGNTWVEDPSDPIGPVVSHYGRWVFLDAYNRWAWIPDTTWGPGWVDWQNTYVDNVAVVGWAPLPPVGYSVSYVPANYYRWCDQRYLGYRDAYRYTIPSHRVYESGWRGRTWHDHRYDNYGGSGYAYRQPTYTAPTYSAPRYTAPTYTAPTYTPVPRGHGYGYGRYEHARRGGWHR